MLLQHNIITPLFVEKVAEKSATFYFWTCYLADSV